MQPAFRRREQQKENDMFDLSCSDLSCSDLTCEELVSAAEAEEREWLSTDDIQPYKSRYGTTVPTVPTALRPLPKLMKFNTYLLNHFGADMTASTRLSPMRARTGSRLKWLQPSCSPCTRPSSRLLRKQHPAAA